MSDPATTETAPVLLAARDGVAHVRLNRPPLHILDVATNRALAAAIRELAARPAAEVRVVVLGSAGGRAFSAGVAIEEHTGDRVGEMLGAFHGVFRALAELRAPVLAAVRGAALGGGLELVAFCDAVIAEESATFGLPEIKLGCYPPVAALLLPGVIGRQRAADLILSGETIDATRAHAIGLVSQVVPDGRLERVLPSFVERYSRHSAVALALAREAMGGGDGRGPRGAAFLAALARAEKDYLGRLMETHDANEGVAAWMAKRPPTWRHS
ncbi:MAG: enoyl-CoA hydratase-related protein [Candidatus Eisenbacteria bacterium]